MEIFIPLAVILALLFTSAFFSGGELAMMALDQINIETGVRRGDRLAILQKQLRSRPQRFLSTILIGYNVANISLATYAAGLAHRYLVPIEWIGDEWALVISGIVMTITILILAELMPKTIAAINSEGVARWVTYPLYICDILLRPLNLLIEKLVLPFIYWITRGKRVAEVNIGREELATALTMAHAGGELHGQDVAVAQEALSLSTRDLADVMTPRVDVLAIAGDATLGEAMQLMMDSGFSRIPVFAGDLDEVTGMLLLKDLVRLNLKGQTGWEKQPPAALQRRIAHMPHTKNLVETLAEMQRQRIQMVVVVDEHGGTEGIVTLEDIMEELVGDIIDESDAGGSADVIHREDGMAIVSGRARVEQLPELAGIDAAAYEATTIGGLLMEVLGRPAIVGDSVDVGIAVLTAKKVLRNRIKLVRIDCVVLPETGNGEAGGES